MSTTNDGGQAYPTVREYQHGGGAGYERIDGMSLREWFAGQALAGLATGAPERKLSPAQVATLSYGYADAMIAARNGGAR